MALLRRHAAQILGAIRLLNGAAALVAPSMSARRLGSDPEASPAPLYPLRMFGVRTVVLGVELLWGDERTKARSLRVGRFIHASDTLSAALGGIRRQLPAPVAVLLTTISSFNTLLAFLGSSATPPPLRRRLHWGK
jgi:uncharacterized protein YjeT (DUF2065 family)